MAAREAPPHLFVVFGATGDLATRKLLPAVHRLSRSGALAGGMRVLGVARDRDLDDDGFRQRAREALEAAGIEDLGPWCEECLSYLPVEASEDDFRGLGRRIEEIEREAGLPGNRVFYLAVPPAVFPAILRGLGEAGLAEGPGFTRVVAEKPFGSDLESARELNATAHRWFDESQIYRIDHFLGKDTVQNLLVLRFANPVLETLWDRERVDHVQITVAEDLGLEGRAGYFDGVGVVRDMVQNHLTQVLALAAMEVPVAYDAESIRAEKTKVLRALRPPGPGDVVLGRYAAGEIDGHRVPGYLDEEGVPEDSRTETFAALALSLENWRWEGVPFYLRTGKRMAQRRTEIAVTFRSPPVSLFRSLDCPEVARDVLVATLEPDEGFTLEIDVKRPGDGPVVLEKVPLDFRYATRFGELPDAYATLLLDVLLGDPTLFVHAREVELAWQVYEPLLERRGTLHDYPAGSWGPRAADELLARDGRAWRVPGETGACQPSKKPRRKRK